MSNFPFFLGGILKCETQKKCFTSLVNILSYDLHEDVEVIFHFILCSHIHLICQPGTGLVLGTEMLFKAPCTSSEL